MFSDIYGANLKPRLQKLLSLLKLDVVYVRASGEHLYYMNDGKEVAVIDMVGGFGSTILGHHSPELKAEMLAALDEQTPVYAQGSISRYSALLGQKLNDVIHRESPQGLKEDYLVHLANTGTEATEASIKHALMEWNGKRERVVYALRKWALQEPQAAGTSESLIEKIEQAQPRIVALNGSFHGKTAGALAVTSNPEYSAMYSRPAISTRFIARDTNPADVTQAFQEDAISLPSEIRGLPPVFSPVMGAIIEVIQGEAGVRVVGQELVRAIAHECETLQAPLIVDEIQSGMYRTGNFLACHAYGIDPAYITLGKSLGGGMMKIAALLVRRSHYQEQFGILHTSTFSEDDLSSRVSLRTLELLEADAALPKRAARFEQTIREGLGSIARDYPGVIADVRGCGFLIGIEFTEGMAEKRSALTDILGDIGLTTYVYASYLMHRHGVRVLPTLSQSHTMRLQPCSTISEESVTKLLEGIRDLASKIHAGRLLAISSHLWGDDVADADMPVVSKFRVKGRSQGKTSRRITFLSHLISDTAAARLDPMLEKMPADYRKRFVDGLWPMAGSAVYHEQEIEGANGERVCLELRGLFGPTHAFEQSIRRGDRVAYKKVVQGVLDSMNAGSSHVGLGQYTSIVTNNGSLARSAGVSLTTGNSLTIGLAYQALKQLLAKRGQRLSDLVVGIVGVAGNICNVYAQMVADEAGAITLIHRQPMEESPKFRSAIQSVLDHSEISLHRIKTSCSVEDLSSCDVVILGTNTTKQIILPEHLKKNALVLDISVPSNIHPSVMTERPDVECFQAGYARLPMGQQLTSLMVPTPNGEIFGCMAETVTVGLLNYAGDFSYGALSKNKVLQSLVMAKEVGIELGSLKKMEGI